MILRRTQVVQREIERADQEVEELAKAITRASSNGKGSEKISGSEGVRGRCGSTLEITHADEIPQHSESKAQKAEQRQTMDSEGGVVNPSRLSPPKPLHKKITDDADVRQVALRVIVSPNRRHQAAIVNADSSYDKKSLNFKGVCWCYLASDSRVAITCGETLQYCTNDTNIFIEPGFPPLFKELSHPVTIRRTDLTRILEVTFTHQKNAPPSHTMGLFPSPFFCTRTYQHTWWTVLSHLKRRRYAAQRELTALRKLGARFEEFGNVNHCMDGADSESLKEVPGLNFMRSEDHFGPP